MRRHNPIGKVFTGEELLAIGNLCVEHNIIMLSDEVSLNRYEWMWSEAIPTPAVLDKFNKLNR